MWVQVTTGKGIDPGAYESADADVQGKQWGVKQEVEDAFKVHGEGFAGCVDEIGVQDFRSHLTTFQPNKGPMHLLHVVCGKCITEQVVQLSLKCVHELDHGGWLRTIERNQG